MPVLIFTYIVLIILTCGIHGSDQFRGRYAFFKILTSLCFVAIALLAGYKGGFSSLYFYLLPGFWFAVAGDFLLGLAHTKRNYKGTEFLLGAAAFTLAHVAFYAAYTVRFGFRTADLIFPLVFTVIMFFFVRREGFVLGRMKLPGTIYPFFVALILSKGATLLFFEGWMIRHAFVLCGGLFFLISDMVILFMYFRETPSKRSLGILNLATYYLAMGFLAMSLYPFS